MLAKTQDGEEIIARVAALDMAIVVAVRVAVNDLTLRGFENLIEVPFQESAVRPVGPALRQLDNLPCPRVELVTIAEVFAQPRADQQPSEQA